MNEILSDFIRSNKIDSIHKLNLLLFLYQNPDTQGTGRCFAEKLYLGDTRLIEKVIHELAEKEIMIYTGHQYLLADAPEIKTSLQHLAISYEHPLTRQTLLAQIQSRGKHGVY